MKPTLQNIIKSIRYVAPGLAVSGSPGHPSEKNWLKKVCHSIQSKELAGIDISDGHICAAYLTQSENGEVELQRAGWDTYTLNEAEESITRKITKLWKECAIPTHLVATCLHTRSLAIKQFKYTGLSDSDLESALRLEAEEALQLPPHEIVFDWHINQTDGAPNNPVTSGVLVAVPARKVRQQVKMLRNAGLYPALIDTAPTATSNLYFSLKGSLTSGESIALINLSSHHADICVLYDGDGLYPRSIFSHAETWDENTDYLLETLQDALLYYHIKINKDPITKILLTGDVPETDGFIEKIESVTRLPAERWNPLDEPNMLISKTYRNEALAHVNQSLMATCLGLALRREAENDNV